MDAPTTVWLAATAVAAVLLALTAVLTAVQRKTLRRERARAEALATVAHRLEATLSALEPPEARASAPAAASTIAPRPAPPLVAAELLGRAALLDALADGVERARADGSRLSAAVVRLEHDAARDLSSAIGALAGVPVYAVGPRSLALVLPDVGRAGALGVLARIQAEQCAGKGRAVELELGEDATELAARLLELELAPD